MLRIFNKSNTYNTLHMMYRELGGFGTGLSVLLPNFQNVIHHNPMTVGEYALGLNHEGFVDKLTREFKLDVEQAASWFGLGKLSPSAQAAYAQSNYATEITVVHIIEPNTDREPGYRDNKNMAFKSCYWDKSDNGATGGLLSDSGFRSFPALAPRWDVLWNDTYGSSPGMDALGDLMQLQHQQYVKSKAIDYQGDPPLQVPTSLRGSDADFLPGGVSYYDGNGQHSGIRTAFEVELDLSGMREDIGDIRQRLSSAFYADLFLMLANADKNNMTATEVAERHEEKLLMLGPVLERLHNELLDPLIESTFHRMIEAGIVPPPPEAMQGMELQVEFVSMLAQAQRAVQVNATDRLLGHIGMIAQAGQTDVLDKFNGDKSVERYADQLGVDPDLIVADKDVAVIRSQRQQMQQAAATAQMANSAADTAQKLGNVSTGPAPEDNAAKDILGLFSGYQSPTGVEV
jgi:hypothetical protein